MAFTFEGSVDPAARAPKDVRGAREGRARPGEDYRESRGEDFSPEGGPRL